MALDGAGYTYDNAGNRTSKTNYLSNVSENYTYDSIYQLTQVTQGVTTTESYSYDAVGNRLSSLGMSPYTYNSSNELTSTPAATFTYDGNGNTATKVDASGTTTYTWDFENRLISAVVPGVGTVGSRYDPFGRRIQKSGPNGTINYVYDSASAIEEVDGSGSLLARYTQGDGIDEVLGSLRSGSGVYYQQDGIGSVTSLSAATATISTSYAYDMFGNSALLTGSFVNPYRYTGRDFDPETELQYSRQRYYDPSIGRFLNEDPLGFGGDGTNFYAYVLNSPTRLTDSFGLSAEAAKNGLCQVAEAKLDGRCRLFLEKLANMHGVSVDGLIAQLQSMAGVAQNYLYDGPSSSTPLDADKFGDSSSAGAQTVSQWFGQNDGSIALSQQNGAAIFLKVSDWGTGFAGTFSPFSSWGGDPTPYALGVLTHELLHKQMVGGGFNHQQMAQALDAVGALATLLDVKRLATELRRSVISKGVRNEEGHCNHCDHRSVCWALLALRHRRCSKRCSLAASLA